MLMLLVLLLMPMLSMLLMPTMLWLLPMLIMLHMLPVVSTDRGLQGLCLAAPCSVTRLWW